MRKKIPVITIDGPSGTGKGTTSQILAQRLGWHYLDSGALYRVLAFAAKQHHVAMDNTAALQVLAAHLDVQFSANGSGDLPQVIFEGANISHALRTEECGNNASKIAALREVREALLDRQHAFREAPGLVTDGRDMGSVVFPDALLKIFMVASLDARVQRRYKQLKDKGVNVTLAQLVKELATRDTRDQERSVSPLKPADDAIIIDTTDLHIEQVLERILVIARKALQELEDEENLT